MKGVKMYRGKNMYPLNQLMRLNLKPLYLIVLKLVQYWILLHKNFQKIIRYQNFK